MRKDYINWKDYFMAVAKLSALRSKDPTTQVGACIVDRDNKIVSVGYNGMPYGTEDMSAHWSKEGKWEETKYPYVCHAELNAILNSPRSVKGCIIYITHHPCNECAKAIVQSGISEVVFNEYKEGRESDVAKVILNNANVTIRKHETDLKEIIVQIKG